MEAEGADHVQAALIITKLLQTQRSISAPVHWILAKFCGFHERLGGAVPPRGSFISYPIENGVDAFYRHVDPLRARFRVGFNVMQQLVEQIQYE